MVEYELGWEYLYDDVAHKVNNLNDLLGDKKFTASGSRYTAKLDKQNDDSGKTITGSCMLNTADGSFSGTLESRSDSWNTTQNRADVFRQCAELQIERDLPHQEHWHSVARYHADHDRIQCRAEERAACRRQNRRMDVE